VEHLTERVRQSDAAKLARQRCAQASRAYLQTGGIIQKEDVNCMKCVKQDYNELVEKNRLRPQWRKVMAELQDYCLAKGIIV
jgi:hypothetical protein